MLVLDELDNKILTLIGEDELHPSEMARKLGVLRTTIQYRLRKIEELGLAKKRTVGKKTLWSAVVRQEHNKSHFKIYKGNDFVQAYRQLLSLPAETTVLAIQGSRAAKGEFTALPAQFIKEAHRVFKRKRFVLRGVTNEQALRAFTGLEESMIQSHVGRTLGIKLFRDNHFLGSGEIMSTKKLLLLSNPIAKQVVVIKDKGITEIVYDILDLVFEILDGRNTFDLNNYLRSKIASN
jgi:DNA-binding Lrp family transcriptional regulator